MRLEIGFTGTQKGMTVKQKLALVKLLAEYPFNGFHHGDCIGADIEAHKIIYAIWGDKSTFVLHPPTDPSKRAWANQHGGGSVFIEMQRPYLERNKSIADSTQLLIVCPKERHQILRSGTWATFRYSRKKGYWTFLVLPDGTVEEFEERNSGR